MGTPIIVSGNSLARPASALPVLSRIVRKWARIFSVYLQDALAYRAVAILWILTDTIPSILQPLLWLAAFHGRARIGGYSPSQITAYYLVLLVVTNLVQCHSLWEIAADIKEGRFSAYLIRPFSYGVMNYLAFVSWRIMRTALFAPIFACAALLFGHVLAGIDFHPSITFFAALFLAHLVSFNVTYALGLLALYFVETRSLFNVWYLTSTIFSGQIAPLSLFPPALRVVADILPFRYSISFPAEILLGRVTGSEIRHGLMMQVVWIALGWAASRVIWKTGVRRFAGVGL